MEWLAQVSLGSGLDILSIAIGLLLGAALAYGLFRLLQRRPLAVEEAAEEGRPREAWVRAGLEESFHAENRAFLEKYHLGGEWANLDRVLVEPRVEFAPEALLTSAPITVSAAELRRLWPRLARRVALPPPSSASVRKLLQQGRRVIVSGAAGEGKTTLLACCARLCSEAKADGPYEFLLPVLPLFVHLSELLPALEPAPLDVVEPLERVVRRRWQALDKPEAGLLLREKLATGKLLLLLDGGDELRPEKLPVAWLRRLLDEHADIQVICAAPVVGYGPLLELGFTLSGILPWRQGQAATLAEKWTTVASVGEPPPLGTYWRAEWDPLEITMVLWQQAQLLPGVLARRNIAPKAARDVYEPVLTAWLRPRGKEPEWLGNVGRPLWERMGYELLVREQFALDEATVNCLLDEVLAGFHLTDRERPAMWRIFRERSLFVIGPENSLAFRSPRWRDYLAASHLATHDLHTEIVAHIHDTLWSDVVRFYIGRKGESGLSEWMLDPRSTDLVRDRLFQAVEWFSEVDDPEEWRRTALIQLGQLVVRTEAPLVLRQRAIVALAATREKGVVPLLRQLMQRAEAELRQAAVVGFASQEPEVAIPALERLVQDQDATVRELAVHALGWMAHPDAERPLLISMIEPDLALNRAAAEQFALNGGEGWTILREAAEEESASVRRAAVHGLALVDQPWTYKILRGLHKPEEDWSVRSAAQLALEDVDAAESQRWEPAQAGDAGWLRTWAREQQQIVPAGAAALPVVLDMAQRAPSMELQLAALRTLARVYLPAHYGELAQSVMREVWQQGAEAVANVAFSSWMFLQRCYGGEDSK